MLDPCLPNGCALARLPPLHRNGRVEMAATLLYVNGFDRQPMELEKALRDYFLARRPVAHDRFNRRYPETLVYEIAQAAATIYHESQSYKDKVLWQEDDDYAGHGDAVKRYSDFYKRLRNELDALPPGATYPKNADAWHEMRRVVVKLAVAADNPPPERSIIKSVVHGVRELPQTLSTVAEAVSEAAIRPVKRNLLEVAKLIAIPVAIGGAAIVGVVLLTRSGRSAS
jgi:hypothetical protein